jgi:hypothetical protein
MCPEILDGAFAPVKRPREECEFVVILAALTWLGSAA